MRRLLTGAAFAAVFIGSALPALAIESKPFACEKAVVVELAKFSRARGKCIATCVTRKQAKPSLYTCHPGFDPKTQECAQKTVDKYGAAITKRCTGYMPPCGGFEKGYCGEDTSLICNRGLECSVSLACRRRCSVTITTACDTDGECPMGEQCVSSGTPKDIPAFIAGNLFEGDPIPIVDQIDTFSEALFQCRQSVCSDTGDLCGDDVDCPGASCTPGKCSNGALCIYDGDCGTGTTKKCIALGRCSNSNTSCTIAGDCPGGSCQRYGRCHGPGNNGQVCYEPADCPNPGGTCDRTTTDTDRKVEQKCTTGVSNALANYTYAIANCQAKCAQERDLKDGFRCTNDTAKKCKTDEDCGGGLLSCLPTSCDPNAIGRCSNDIYQVCAGNGDCASPGVCNPTTPLPGSKAVLDCRDKAFTKAIAYINKKCPSLPACGAYSPFGGVIGNFNRPEDLIGFVVGRQDGQFREDDPDLSPGSNFCQP